MALALSLLQADPDTSNVSSYAAPSSSPAANSALIAIVTNTDGTNAIRPTFSSAFSTGGWTDEGSILASASTRRMTLFTATATSSPGSGTCTADFAGDSQTGCTIHLLQITGQDAGDWFINFGSNEAGASGATSLTLTLPSALSNANNMMVAGIMHNTIEDQTATGGGVELASSDVSYNTPATQCGIYSEVGDNSLGASWSTSSAKLSIGGEIVASTATPEIIPALVTARR